jgi:type I protein arginine methyltransferase
MASPAEKIMRSFLAVCKKMLMASRFGRKVIYDLNNSAEFGDLYEHEKMLADKVRLNGYSQGIARYIGPDDTVIDLGTGTGILSFLAARQNPRKIFAIDHSDFIEVARLVARKNNINNIEFIQENSRNFAPPEKIDVILHEQIGDDLFNENMVENLLDLKRRVLKAGGRILPGRFEIFLEPVCLREDYRVPFLGVEDIMGIDFRFLKDDEYIRKYQTVSYKHKPIEARAVKYFLCTPKPVYSFDLNEMEHEGEILKDIRARKQVITAGAMHGLCFYFRVVFAENLSFDTSPLSTSTHWGNKLFRLEERRYEQGELISFDLTMNNLEDINSWTVSLEPPPS